MIKQFVIIFLLTAFTVQTFNKSLIVFNYFTHTADYAKDCINKAKPMMHCNGRCQMFKKLRQEENNDKQNPERRNDNKDEVLYCNRADFSVKQVSVSLQVQYPAAYIYATTDIAPDFFQPPRTLC